MTLKQLKERISSDFNIAPDHQELFLVDDELRKLIKMLDELKKANNVAELKTVLEKVEINQLKLRRLNKTLKELLIKDGTELLLVSNFDNFCTIWVHNSPQHSGPKKLSSNSDASNA
jgi:hypothetical protein